MLNTSNKRNLFSIASNFTKLYLFELLFLLVLPLAEAFSILSELVHFQQWYVFFTPVAAEVNWGISLHPFCTYAWWTREPNREQLRDWTVNQLECPCLHETTCFGAYALLCVLSTAGSTLPLWSWNFKIKTLFWDGEGSPLMPQNWHL